ncbi:hypothetical protein ACHHV8_31565 [Paenibacillus sp. TAB 01]|uniref:hypothetical protein n=1 Tax=Paenibacillus sp. TAB 01 TaxID=3368988 RepID=UPI0037536D2D
MSLNLTFALQKRILSLVLVIVLLCGMVAPLPSVHAAGGPYLVDANAKAMNFNLNKADLLTGSGKDEGTAYRYHNVIPDSATPVDAIVTISKLGSKASLGKFDDEGSNSNRFQPVLTTTGTAQADELSGNNSVEYTVEFKSGSIDGEEYSNDDVYIKDFYLTVIDIDGSSATNTEFVEISGYESFTIHKDNALKDKGVYSQTTGRTRFTGINTSLVSPSGGPEFDNTASFIANYTVPVHSMKLVIGNTRNLGDRQFSLNFGEPGGVYTDPKPPVPNSATVDIDVQIADGGDGYLTSSELGSVTVSGQTDAPQEQLVFISLKDNAQGTPHLADYMVTVGEGGSYTVQADLSSFTGTVTATASVIDSLGNPGTAKATTAVNNVPVASIVSIQGNAVVGGHHHRPVYPYRCGKRCWHRYRLCSRPVYV